MPLAHTADDLNWNTRKYNATAAHERAYSVGVLPYTFLKVRMKRLLSANCQWAASSVTLTRPACAVSASQASSSRRRRVYEITVSPAAVNAVAECAGRR